MSNAPYKPWPERWRRVCAASLRSFHAYANWLVGISWRRFVVLALLLLVLCALLKDMPPFSWRYTRTISHEPVPAANRIDPPTAPAAPAAPAALPAPTRPDAGSAPGASASRPGVHITTPGGPGAKGGVSISIDETGVRVEPVGRPLAGSATSQPGASKPGAEPSLVVRLAEAELSEGVKQAVEAARQAIQEAVADARDARNETVADAQEAAAQARANAKEAAGEARRAAADAKAQRSSREVHVVGVGDFLPNLALLWIIGSLIIKITYKRQIQAEAQAAQAVETAGAESLKRQVVEARMAAMQAQVEPHFLFNTLASIDHLIETDPRRASQMQKNLIALLRASMPTMREASDGGVRELGRELAVIRPYLEILKVRMEERLTTRIDVPEGLQSAEFPPMMLQTLVENAVKHGLEPKPEGGHLQVRAEIVHGRLALTVADTGLGFGRAATAGTGVGLANIRERLQLLFGQRAALTIAENPGGGTRVTISLPYKAVQGMSA